MNGGDLSMNNNELNWDTFIAMGYGEKKIYKKNAVLFHPGEIGRGFYYLLTGEVKISVISNEGHESRSRGVTWGTRYAKRFLYLYSKGHRFLNGLFFFKPNV